MVRRQMTHTLGAGDNATTVRSNVNAGDGLVVALELVLQLEGIANLAIELDGGVSGNGQRLMVRREGMVSDGAVEKMVNFGSGHCEDEVGLRDRSSSLLPLCQVAIGDAGGCVSHGGWRGVMMLWQCSQSPVAGRRLLLQPQPPQ